MLSSFFRLLWLIPIGVIAALLGSGSMSVEGTGYSWSWAAGGILFVPVLLMILFRQKYPRWWFDWNLELSRFLARVGAYAMLLRDEYPSTDEQQAVHLDFAYPDAKQLNRLLPIVKWFLAIPHWFVLCFLGIAAVVCVIIAWFAILFTGRYPAVVVRLRGGGEPVGAARGGLRAAADHRPVPAVLAALDEGAGHPGRRRLAGARRSGDSRHPVASTTPALSPGRPGRRPSGRGRHRCGCVSPSSRC